MQGSWHSPKHVAHYGRWSDFLYYNLNISDRDALYLLPGDTLSSSVGLSPGNIHQYPVLFKMEALYNQGEMKV